MADNTKQFNWIVHIKLGVEALFKEDPNVFVAADLLWYPLEGDNKTSTALDTMVFLVGQRAIEALTNSGKKTTLHRRWCLKFFLLAIGLLKWQKNSVFTSGMA